jgi:hypothetical protein
MFDLLQRHGENICFRCGDKIESAAELSIEHKQPWLDVSAELFWDLSNIAFLIVGVTCLTARTALRRERSVKKERLGVMAARLSFLRRLLFSLEKDGTGFPPIVGRARRHKGTGL